MTTSARLTENSKNMQSRGYRSWNAGTTRPGVPRVRVVPASTPMRRASAVADASRCGYALLPSLLALALWLLGTMPARAVDLMDVYRLALTSDPQYQAAEAANLAVKQRPAQARADLLPQVSTGYNYAGSRNITFRSGFVLNITQPVFHMDRIVALDQAHIQVRQSDAQYAFALQDLIVRVATRYFGVLRAMDNLEFTRGSTQALAQQLKQAQQRYEVGLIAITDVQEARAGYDSARADEIKAENDLDNARENLREITGRYLHGLLPLGSKVPLVTPQPDDIDQWTATALAQNRQLEASRLASANARDEIKRQESGHLPTLDVTAQAGPTVSSSTGLTGAGGGNIIELQLNVPIFQGFGVMSRTREAQYLHRQSLDELEFQRRTTQSDTRKAFLGVISGISQVKALQQAVISNQSAFDATKAGFEVGTRTAVDVLTSNSDLLQAKRNYAGARYDYVLSLLSLKQAAGTLSVRDLEQVNSWLKQKSGS